MNRSITNRRPGDRWPAWEILLFVAFLIWSAAGILFTGGHVTPANVAAWNLPPALLQFVAGCIKFGDPVLILLAFANTHAQAARQWTHARARRWALVVVVGSLLIETVGVSTGLIFGDYSYTDRFGPKLGLVPMTIPLAWYIVVTNALFLVRMVAPSCPRLLEAALTGLVCTLYDAMLEPFATVTKGYWIWAGGVIPAKNYLAWFVLSGLMVWIFAPHVSARHPRDLRPVVVLAVMLLLFLVAR